MASLSIILLVLALAVVVTFAQAQLRRQRDREVRRSNARVLREFKRIARNEPTRIFERQE